MEKTVKGFESFTVAEKFEAVKSILETVGADTEKVEFIQERIDLVNKRNANRKPTQSKTNKEKLADVEAMQEWFFENANPDTFYSSNELIEALELKNADGTNYTPQKMTSRLKVLVDNGTVEKGLATSDKKKVGYKAK